MSKAKILRLHLSERDKYDSKPLYEAIVHKCREMKIAGATVFRGLEGYGQTADIHRRHFAARDQPIVIMIIDSEDRISELLPIVEAMMDTGVIAMSDVEALRVERGVNASKRT